MQILPAAQSVHSSIAGPDNWMVFDNGSAREQAAWTFLTWLTSAQTARRVHAGIGRPADARVGDQAPRVHARYLAKYPGDAVFVSNLKNVTQARPNTKTYPQVSQAIGSQIQGVLIGHTSPQDALDAAAKQADSALASGQ